jgi:predicted DNA-binding transcriptional regulator AlpA
MQLIGVYEIAARLGLSRQRVYKLIETHLDFPKPIAELHSGRIWKASDIDRWASKWAKREPRRRDV